MVKIRLNTLQEMAPIYYKEVKKHITALKAMRNFTGNYESFNQQIENSVIMGGLSSADFDEYDPYFLEYPGFRMIVVLYTCACIITNLKSMSMEDFRGYMNALRESMGGEFDQNDAIQYLSKNINIDNSLIPSNVKVNIARSVEEREANKICETNINLIRKPDPGETFESYKSFIGGRAEKMITDLNNSGYMHSYPLDIFTMIVLLKKLNFQLASLYRIDGFIPLPVGAMHAIAKQLFEFAEKGIIGGNIIGGVIGPDVDE